MFKVFERQPSISMSWLGLAEQWTWLSSAEQCWAVLSTSEHGNKRRGWPFNTNGRVVPSQTCFKPIPFWKVAFLCKKRCPIAEIVSSSDGLRDLSPKSLSSVGDFCEERSQSQSLKKNILATWRRSYWALERAVGEICICPSFVFSKNELKSSVFTNTELKISVFTNTELYSMILTPLADSAPNMKFYQRWTWQCLIAYVELGPNSNGGIG